ncbi:putative MFS-type transporter C09D4.1 [Fragariocoptes setiger]|uniref:MFS-type transporter C09D4.1 n=1 Tax=Fragariocoptes setiger TaxID=1670756 RepID=A0ABQ7SCI0_9ACAR|nr:putative MFS-type transporter C09D4.1 [Fragariocoptes setiger]
MSNEDEMADKSTPTSALFSTTPATRSTGYRSKAKLLNQAKRKEFFENYNKFHQSYLSNFDDDSIAESTKLQNNNTDPYQPQHQQIHSNSSNKMVGFESVQVYRKRYAILALFCAYSMINSFQWIEYSSITSVLSLYYNVDHMSINWTSIVYMIVYIPLIIPTSWLMECIGLRNSIIIGSLGTTIGALIKCFSVHQTHFWLTMIGQTVVAVSQLFIISVPPRLAAVWYSDDQVSRATACGVFGNQLGIAIGFVVPPALVYGSQPEEIAHGLHQLFNSVAGVSCVVSLAILLFLDERPPKPPGIARLEQLKLSERQVVTSTTKTEETVVRQPKIKFASCVADLICNINFMLLFISYGLNVGTFYAISTVLNQMLQHYGSDKMYLVGMLGLTIVVTGMIGSIVCGHILDRTHAFKSITIIVYLLSLAALGSFAFVIRDPQHGELLLYGSSAFLGFFMTGYLPIGLEFGAEISYPRSETISAGLLNMSSQAFGIGLTFATSYLVDHYESMWANIFLAGCLFVGLLLSVAIRVDMKRQKAIRPSIS